MSEVTRILIVEDEQHLAMGIKYNLEAEGYDVTIVSEGSQAMDLVSAPDHGFRLIVLDIMLPGMSGYSICEQIRSRGDQVAVLFLSARTLPEDRARGFDVGANQYLTKPFDLDELLSRVRNLLRQTVVERRSEAVSHAHHDRLEFGQAQVDFDTHEVTVDGRPIKMTKMELDLLRYFGENEGRVIPREELLEEVWKVAPYAQTRAPDQFMRRLRKAFEPDPSKPVFFLTIRDAGYRFVREGQTGRSAEDAQEERDGREADDVDGED